MDIAEMELYFASDLKNYGTTEDGTPFIGEVFYVEVENARGDRWRLTYTFDGVRKEEFEEGIVYQDVRPEVRERMARLVANIRETNTINMMYWLPARPAYGSAAYIAYGQADDLALEREEG